MMTVLAQVGIDLPFVELVTLAGTLVLVLIVLAAGAFAYRAYTGTLTWPTDTPEDPDELQRGADDDEWKYY
jgi:hypothetical protein